MTITEFITELQSYLYDKYSSANAQEKDKLIIYINGLKQITDIIIIYDNYKTALVALLNSGFKG